MILLVDYFCDKVVLMDESSSIKVIHKDKLIELIKHKKIKVDNLSINDKGNKLICSSGSLDRLERMKKVATVISKTGERFNCYINTRESGTTGTETFSENTFKSLIKHELVFNAFLREGSIVVKGPVFNKLKQPQETVTVYKGSIILKDIKRIDGELAPTFFELNCDNETIANKLVDILRKEYGQSFSLSDTDGSCVFDSIKHDTSCYINFAEKYGLEVLFNISIYDIDELMEYAEDMSWVAKKFKEFIVKYSKYKFEMDENVQEILQ